MNNNRLNKVLEIFKELKPKRILDVGCGNGQFCAQLGLVSGTHHLNGIDIDEGNVKSASFFISAKLKDVNKDCFDSYSSEFDGIFCGEVIEHLVNTDHLLDEIYHHLSHSGFCVITAPNLGAWYNRISLVLGCQPFYTEVSEHNVGKLCNVGGKTTAGHLRAFTLKALKELLEIHNFEIIKVYGCNDPNIPFPINILDKLFSKIPSLSGDIIIVVRKK